MRWYWIVGAIVLLGFILGDDDTPSNIITTEPKTPTFTATKSTTSTRLSNTVERTTSISLFVTGNAVNVRSGPSVGSSILGKKYKGDVVQKIDQSGNWTKINFGSNFAWISSNYVSSQRPIAPSVRSNPQPKRTVAAPTSREISLAKKEIIRRSIAQYPGSCPCPYNRDRAGRRCGGRSAWSKPGGYSPLCYESDISNARIQTYFTRVRGASN